VVRYFAYGSNMLHQRLTARCASARVRGVAVLPAHRVGFAKYSWMDGSGKATILPARDARTEGVLYDLDDADIVTLDAIEGVGKGYRRQVTQVLHAGAEVDAVTYEATDPDERQKPFDWYLALVLAGALQNHLSALTLDALRTVPWEQDTVLERPGRIAAVDALTAAGHADWQRLLAAD
jgi:gamma-glutamylcyclotransferase (GGCT)/AIG2-like uncharacterized protein YtfP